MTPALAHHLTQCPVSPGNVGANHPDYIAYHGAMTTWTMEKERLEVSDRVAIITLQADRQPHCSPRADYIYREPVKRKRSRPVRPQWSGATKEYKREKQAEYRARVRSAVLEVQAERKAS